MPAGSLSSEVGCGERTEKVRPFLPAAAMEETEDCTYKRGCTFSQDWRQGQVGAGINNGAMNPLSYITVVFFLFVISVCFLKGRWFYLF